MRSEGPDGEIGRRSGLKIRGPERAVGVQVSLRAPKLLMKNAGNCGGRPNSTPEVSRENKLKLTPQPMTVAPRG